MSDEPVLNVIVPRSTITVLDDASVVPSAEDDRSGAGLGNVGADGVAGSKRRGTTRAAQPAADVVNAPLASVSVPDARFTVPAPVMLPWASIE